MAMSQTLARASPAGVSPRPEGLRDVPPLETFVGGRVDDICVLKTVKADPGCHATERYAYGLTTIWTWVEGLTSASKAS
jgi:hypothetical protein